MVSWEDFGHGLISVILNAVIMFISCRESVKKSILMCLLKSCKWFVKTDRKIHKFLLSSVLGCLFVLTSNLMIFDKCPVKLNTHGNYSLFLFWKFHLKRKVKMNKNISCQVSLDMTKLLPKLVTFHWFTKFLSDLNVGKKK